MKPALSNALAISLGLACAGVLVWVWRSGSTAIQIAPPLPVGSESAPALTADSAAFTTAAPASLPPELRSMLAALMSEIAFGRAREGEAVLAFKDDDALQRFLARASRQGLTISGQLGSLRAVRVRLEGLEALQRDMIDHAADYSAVAANSLVGIPQPPPREERADLNQIPFGNDTLPFIGATGDRAAWGQGTTIAILDTGVSADSTFGNGRLRTLDIGFGYGPGRGGDDGHGTAVAALAAGAAADAGGVAPAAGLLSIRVTDASGLSDLFTLSQGIVAAADAGAQIINISLGGYSTGAVLDSAIAYATQRGALIVAAAGNDQAAQLAWPAADQRVVSVGAVDKAEQQVKFSNSSSQLTLSAPGYGVQTAWLDARRVYVDATSASAPLVSGAIAAVMSRNPGLSPRQAADLLATTANDCGEPGPDAAFGHGVVNLGTALNRNNPAYVDTAVSSHHFDPATGQLSFVVQNRSGRTLSGLALDVSAGTTTTRHSVPSLAAGETFVTRVPVNDAQLRSSGNITYSTRLVNPIGTVDQQPDNNTRTSVLSSGGR